jgi:rare lipoprotein A
MRKRLAKSIFHHNLGQGQNYPGWGARRAANTSKDVLMQKSIAIALFSCFLLPSVGQADSWTGKASYYSMSGNGNKTASGSRFHSNNMTAAHRTLPFGTSVRVTNLENGRSVLVTINDRGPFIRGRVIDVSTHAAEMLAFRNRGVAHVRVDTVSHVDTISH